MANRPRLLDLFCGAGGAAMGYRRAGWDVYGIDMKVQPYYPFWFMRGDVAWLTPEDIRDFDAIHASPPCQQFSAARNVHKREHPDLIAPTRALLEATGRPYVIENVERAPLRAQVMLCGTMFGLDVRRHRWFETNVSLNLPPADCYCRGRVARGELLNYWNTEQRHRFMEGKTAGRVTRSALARAMDIDWIDTPAVSQCIPPAYTEWIGKQLMEALKIAA